MIVTMFRISCVILFFICFFAILRAQNSVDQPPAIVQAAWSGDSKAVAALIAEGVDLNARDRLDCTALIIAAGRGHNEIVSMLVAAGANVNARGYYGANTALTMAERAKNTEMINLLRAAGAE